MSKICTGLAVTGLVLSLASPCAAQGQAVEDGELNRMGARAEDRAGPLFPQGQGLRIVREEVVQRDGSPASRTKLIGSVPMADNVDFGVGIFSVVGQSEKELLRQRNDPLRDARPKDRRVAAVGMSIRF